MTDTHLRLFIENKKKKKKKENQSADELNIDVEDNLAVIMFFNYSGVSEYFKISFRKLFEI